jgi:hypothetical protein
MEAILVSIVGTSETQSNFRIETPVFGQVHRDATQPCFESKWVVGTAIQPPILKQLMYWNTLHDLAQRMDLDFHHFLPL